MSEELYDRLRAYADAGYYPFHMPGHKRNPDSGVLSGWYQLDITEIDGFDNLHEAEGILARAQERAAELYGAQETHFLVNGSTGGILSAVAAVASPGKILLMARNCHKSVYHAAFLNRLETRYLFPKWLEEYDLAGKIQIEEVRRQIIAILRERNIHPEKASDVIAGVVITSPTYEGICSDIPEIARLVHQYGLPLIVDEAHGAHLGFHEDYPDSAVHCGADLVIQSVHKTLPAPTQTSLLHCRGEYVDVTKVRRYLSIYQTSSPSYLLMTGIDEAIGIVKREGRDRLSKMLSKRRRIEQAVASCRHLRLCPLSEPSKLVLSVKNTTMTGKQLYDALRQRYHLQLEMSCGSYALAMMSMMDTDDGITRLVDALLELDREMDFQKKCSCAENVLTSPARKYKIHEVFLHHTEEVDYQKSVGSIAADFVQLYPPGVPLLVPGEVIRKEEIQIMEEYFSQGYEVQGVSCGKIQILKNEEGNL